MTWQRFARSQDLCTRKLDPDAELSLDLLDQPLADKAPPWRRFMPWPEFKDQHAADALERWKQIRQITSSRVSQKADSFYLSDSEPCQRLVLAVNSALALRRPLLVTGYPGSGKSTLAFAIAAWLGLGPVLEWPVTPGALLADALSTYNALARLQDLEIQAKQGSTPIRPVQDYVRLGPVGTAFLPAFLPRVLLIDEIDKGDLNLANELLHLFEEGKFAIAELQRAEGGSEAAPRQVATWDEDNGGQPVTAPIRGGLVQCHEFPLVVMTSNGERDFPPAFNRRCLRVRMPDFSSDTAMLQAIVERHLKAETELLATANAAIELFQQEMRQLSDRQDVLATDQLLNLAYLLDDRGGEDARTRLAQVLLQGLNEPDLDLDVQR
jgi:MoxR-like ATPase